MALYSRTDNDAQKRKVGATNELNSVTTDPAQNPNTQPQAKVIPEQYIFIDDTEATIPENKKRGLTAPGWWKYFTYTDASGETRHKAQHLVAFKDAPTSAGDTDDQYAADASSTITISVQPSSQTADDDIGTATFSVTAAASVGSLVYQWQLQTATGTRWANITGANSDSLALTSIVIADSGKKYRVKLTSSAGATEVISSVATLTVTD